jgi:hypothetical protein
MRDSLEGRSVARRGYQWLNSSTWSAGRRDLRAEAFDGLLGVVTARAVLSGLTSHH